MMNPAQRIRERIAEIESLLASLPKELEELRVTERVLKRFDVSGEGGVRLEAKRPITGSADGDAKPHPPMKTREIFIQVLKESETAWMTANEIKDRASSIKGADIPMGTVSPTLSEMKNAGFVIRDGLKVALAERIKRDGAPSAYAPEPHEFRLEAEQTGAD
jgi:hypothetical protein